MFTITDYIEFDSNGRAICPACEIAGKTSKKNLSLVPGSDGAYKCHRGCSSADIRAALGHTSDRVVPTAIAKSRPGATTLSPEKVREANENLTRHKRAMEWLNDRGITEYMAIHFKLGLARAKCGERHLTAISIPIPANPEGTAYYQKKRVAPWLPKSELPASYQAWSQYGVPSTVFFTYRPEQPEQTWLCEGEWDAILLGWLCLQAKAPVAVATFTTGSSNVPHCVGELPGQVITFYDLDEAGRAGAEKVAAKLGDRCRIATVPNREIHPGYDVSDAIQAGFKLEHFQAAAAQAKFIKTEKKAPSLRDRLKSTEQLIANAPSYQEWLVPDLLTADELFVLGAPPRGGKTLMAMLLAKSIASGTKFLDRPTTQGSVIYVNLEDSDSKVKERVEAQEWAEGLPVYWLDKFKLSETKELIEIAEEMEDLRLIVLDTLSRIRDDDHSESSAEMSYVLEPLQEFCKTRKVCCLIIHHTRKLNVVEDGIEVLFDSLRGSTAIRGTCRGMWILAPTDSEYRLAVETGWGKHDLKIRLDASALEWRLLGKWAPAINLDQKEQVLQFFNKVGNATIDQIAEETAIPKRSLYTVLDRLRADGLIEKTGSRTSALYTRAIQQIQQLNSLLNPPNPDPTSDRGAYSTKNTIFFPDANVKSDHITHAKDDHFFDHPEKSTFLLNRGGKAENADGEGDSGFNKQFNKDSTVELEGAKAIKVFSDGKWRKAFYIGRSRGGGLISAHTGKIHDSHLVEFNNKRMRVSEGDIRGLD